MHSDFAQFHDPLENQTTVLMEIEVTVPSATHNPVFLVGLKHILENALDSHDLDGSYVVTKIDSEHH